ncbi:MAG: amidohydrolase [Chloroflexota bacterium]|nr:amidohydrolase [Chloroflexota bacterium]
MTTTVIRNVRPLGASVSDILIRNGTIDAIGPGAGSDIPGAEVIDGEGRLVFPGLIDAHGHMDKTLMGLPWHRNEVGPTLLDMIENERRVRREERIDFHEQSMRHARAAIAVGTTHIRTHVDVDTEIGLDAIHGVQQTQAAMKDALDIQIVAFPQSGMLVRPGTVELLEAALQDGAELIGGLDPCSIDRDPARHLNVIFGLAQKYDVDIDIHVHEPGELGAFSIDLITERTRVLGYQGRVVISHAFALGGVDEDRLAGLVERIVENDIVIMSHGPGGHHLIPNIKKLRAAEVRLISGNDGIQDAWNPLQRPDVLERAYVMAYRNNLRRDDDIEDVIDIVTYGNAAVMGDTGYGFRPGGSADLVLVDAETHVAAVVHRPPRWLVMKRGRITARDGACLA